MIYTKIRLSRKVILAIIAATVISTVSATAFTFTQHFPAIPATTAPPVLTAGCTTSNLVTGVTSVVPGGTVVGQILFTCPGDVAAITASSSGGSATPTFTLPAGYTALGLVTHTPTATTCGGGSINSGLPISFAASEKDDYCLSYQNVPVAGLAAFDITWAG